MKKNVFFKKMNLVSALAFLLAVGTFTACSDDEPSYSTATVTNSELKTILTGKGYQFNEKGNLLLDDKANQTTQLDLSGTNISADALSELTILPNLTEVSLKNNGYGPVFDFAKLPAQITGIDLTGNEIYDYDNLVKVDVAENGDETVTNLHEITKLYLPNEAKDNIAQLMRFYRQNKTAIDNGTMDVKMVNASGTLEKYTTLREVPDKVLRDYLKTNYSSIFEGDQIDLSKRLNNSEKINNIIINKYFIEDIAELSNFEGIQYIITNPYWEGTAITIGFDETKELPQLKVGSTVTSIDIKNVVVSNGLDLSNATGLIQLYLTDVSGLETVDISASNIWGQRDANTEETSGFGATLQVLGCKNVKSIYFPKATTLKAYTVDIECLDALETCDLTNFSYINTFTIGDVPASYNLIYPNLTEFPSTGQTYFGCSKATYEIQSTKDFINKYKDYNGEKKIRVGNMSYSGNKRKYWT